MSSELILVTEGGLHGGWKNIDVSVSMEQIADSFNIDVTEKWKGQKARRSIRKGESCEVEINGERVITGYVDDVNPTYDAQTHFISIAGRSKTGDLVDCSADTFQWQGLTLAAGAAKLCEPYGISVIDEVGNGEVFNELKGNAGDNVYDIIEQAARIRGVLLMSTPEGNLRIARASNGKSVGKLILGVNAVQASGNNSQREQYSVYKLLEQQSGSAFLSAEESATVEAQITDTSVRRFRQLMINGEYPMDTAAAEKRILNERNVRWGRSQRVTYVVRKWHYNGALWRANTMVEVQDDYQDIHGDRLITAVRYVLNEQGEFAEITVMPREAFDTVELLEPDSTGLLSV